MNTNEIPLKVLLYTLSPSASYGPKADPESVLELFK